jgi:hypothetical protein
LRSWSGQHQHDIAADYRINAGRVSAVLTEKALGSKQVAASLVPALAETAGGLRVARWFESSCPDHIRY